MLQTFSQIFVLAGYLFYLESRFYKLPSISESTYQLSRQQRFMFTGVLWTIGLLNFFQPLEMWSAVAGGLLCFTGVSINFKSEAAHSNIVHYASAGTAIFLSFLGLGFEHGMWIPAIGAGIMCLGVLWTSRIIWWVEIISFGWIMGSYLYLHTL